MSAIEPIVLQHATPQQLEQAAAHNHSELFVSNALVCGGEVQKRAGLTWTYAPGGIHAMIPFPSLDAAHAGEQLDDMMNWYRMHAVVNAGCWSLYPVEPEDLGIRLLARGFQPGWWPGWMALDLQQIKTGYRSPDNLIIQADNHTDTDPIKDLPYAGDGGAISTLLLQKHPEHTQRFLALLDGQIVGHSAVYFSCGSMGVAGIFNVGVVPQERNRGIAKAVVTATCLYAKEKGYRYATLNGTGRRMYEQIGFQWIGNGRTWWLNNNRYITHPASPAQVALAEAICKGDLSAINHLREQFTAEDLNIPTTNGMSYMQLAAHYKQYVSAEWLMQQGAGYTALEAWDMGWKDRAAALLKAHPEHINLRYAPWQGTLLHMAVERNDTALAELALQAKPDLTITDATYNGTALGWAMHLGRTTIMKMIEKYMG